MDRSGYRESEMRTLAQVFEHMIELLAKFLKNTNRVGIERLTGRLARVDRRPTGSAVGRTAARRYRTDST